MFYQHALQLCLCLLLGLLWSSRRVTGLGLKKQFRKKSCRCQEQPHRHAFDSVFKKWILLWFAFVFKVSSYFYKQLELFYLNSTLNFGIPPVLVFQLEVYYKVDRLLTGLTAQQKGTTARWYSNKTSLCYINFGLIYPWSCSLVDDTFSNSHLGLQQLNSQLC